MRIHTHQRGQRVFFCYYIFTFYIFLFTLFSPLFAASVQSWGETAFKSSDFIDNHYITVAAAENHSLAIRPDGSVIAWGRDDFGQAIAPFGNNVIAVAGGYQHSIALKSDGSIVGWGDDHYGQSTPPEGNDFIKIAAGANHSLALKSDGSIAAWGWNAYGQATPPSGNNFVAVSAGYQHSLALKSDGSIVAWGDNYYGQVTPPDGNDFIAVAAGGFHSLALKFDGSIVGWGWNNYGQITSPDGNNFIAVAAGEWHSLALKSDGSIVAWGSNSYNKSTPPDGNDFVAIFAGGNHSLALKSNGDFVGWGGNDYGQSAPPRGNNFIKISTSKDFSLALRSDGSIAAWGNNQYGQATPPEGINCIDIAAGWYHSVALKSDGSLAAWGWNYYNQATPPDLVGFVAVAAGGYHSLALRYNGYIVCWGNNDYLQALRPSGQYTAIAAGGYHSLALTPVNTVVGWGRNSDGQANSPDGRNFVAIAAGNWHSFALRSDGSVAGWGWNGDGQASPPAGNNFVAIAATLAHSLGLKSDGSIVGWGYDERGETSSPPGNDFISIATGEHHSLALYMPQTGDLNGDAFVNFFDYAKFADQWLRPPDPCDPNSGDFTKNGNIDLFDLAQLASNWLTCFVTNARMPLPLDKASNIGISITLQWSPGLHAESHNVYFGTDFNEAKNADISDSNVFMGNQTSISWDINNYDVNGLDYNNTYYWRIDEVAGCTAKGNVWSFTTIPPPPPLPGQASNPAPADEETDVSPTSTLLNWSPGTLATSHDVYFGTANPPPFCGTRPSPIYNPGLMDTNTIYYWRIDEKNAGGTTTGNIWSFKTIVQLPGQAGNPTPANGATGVNNTKDLSWTADSLAASHGVYFGTTNPPPFKANQTTTTYDTATLDTNTIYYWRIDEKNGSGTTTGIVWSFTTAVIFPGQASSPIPANGSTNIDLVTDLRWTAGSLAISHDVYFGTANPPPFKVNQTGTTYNTETMDTNTTYYWRINEKNTSGTTTGIVWSFTTAVIFPGQAGSSIPANEATNIGLTTDLSWTAGSLAASHDVYFGTTNPPPFKSNQTTTTYDTGTMDTNTTYYWRIDEKNAAGITTGDTWSFTTIFQLPGQAGNPTPIDGINNIDVSTDLIWTAGELATSHDVYFGTANPPPFCGTRPSPIYNTGIMDSNTTYYWRIDEKNGSGTTTGVLWSFTTVEPNIMFGLADWWKFDEGTGTIAHDSKGASNGTIYGGATWTTGKFNGALSFNGSSNYVDCGIAPSNYDNITVSAWMKTSTNGVLVSNRYSQNGYGTWYTLSSTGIELGGNSGGVGYMNVTFIKPTLDNAWHHVVYTKNGTSHAIYVDGSPDQSFASNADISQSQPLFIGKRWTKTSSVGWFNGIIDDVRIYNRALTSAEVALLWQQGQ